MSHYIQSMNKKNTLLQIYDGNQSFKMTIALKFLST